MWICHALGNSHATAPAIVPKLHCVYIYTIFTVNRSFFFLSFSFCYLVILLFRGCALHGSRFPVCTNPIGRSPCNLEFLCPIKLMK